MWPDRSLSSVKTHRSLLRVCRKSCEKQDYLVWQNGNQAPFITCTTPVASVFQGQELGDRSGLRESWTSVSTIQWDSDPDYTAKTTQEWLRGSSVVGFKFSGWPPKNDSSTDGPNPIWQSLGGGQICRNLSVEDKWQKIPKSSARLVG